MRPRLHWALGERTVVEMQTHWADKAVQLLALLALVAGLTACAEDSTVGRRLRYIPRRIQTEARSRLPHPNYVPTPDLVADEMTPQVTVPIEADPQPAHTPAPDHTSTASTSAAPDVVPALPTPTLLPASPSPMPSPTAPPTPTLLPLPPATLLTGFSHAWQTWNNCGPATLAMNLSYFGRPETQADTATVLKPDEDDKNVSPYELVAYARSLGFEAIDRVGGNVEMLKRLLSLGIPAIAETWITPKPNDGMGHYRLLIGYDDIAGEFVAFDSYFGPNTRLPYDQFDVEWRIFNRTYVLVYTPDQGELVRRILGDALDDRTMYQAALATAQNEAEQNPDDPFAWFNIGSNLTALGRYDEAATAYDRARRLGLPWRMLWYQFGPFQAYFAVGRYDDVLTLAAANLRNAGNLEESHYWRGRALEALGRTEEARRAFEKALRFNPNYVAAKQALAALQ